MSKRFNDNFKKHAIDLVVQEGQSKSAVARNLSIGLSTLERWVRQSKILRTQSVALPCDFEELKRLRKEVNILRQEREILKKAAAFFAREQQ